MGSRPGDEARTGEADVPLKPHVLRNETEYSAAVEGIDRLLDADPPPGSEEYDRLEFLSVLVQAHEDAHLPVDELTTPQEVVEFMLELKGFSEGGLIDRGDGCPQIRGSGCLRDGPLLRDSLKEVLMLIQRWIAFFAAVVTVLAATPQTHAQRLNREDMAGSTHVAVTSVIPWDEYVAELQPSFALSEDKALEEVDKERRSIESFSINALANRFDLALPTSSASSTSSQSATSTQSNSTTGGVTTETSTQEATSAEASSTTQGPGDVSSTPTGTPIASQAITPTLADEPPEIGGLDPMLRFQAATALYQEVKLLNKYVERAVQRTGYRPYVVRTQVTVAPRTRKIPYDVYANLSFFGSMITEESRRAYENACRSPGSTECKNLLAGMPEEYPTRIQARVQESRVQDPASLSANLTLAKNPIVIPLLVTDSLESTLHSQTMDRIRQFAFGLSFLIQGFGGQNEFQRYRRELERVLGRDFNSLMTVSRLSDNTYRVRLGAVQQVETDYAAIPRNHYITFLLLAPCNVRAIEVSAKSSWIHATNGRALESFPLRQLRNEYQKVARDFADAKFVDKSKRREFADELVDHQFLILINRYREFRSRLSLSPNIMNLPEFPFPTLWSKMAALLARLDFAITSFELPSPQPPSFESGDVLVFDDRTKSTAVIRGRGLVAGKVDARLRVERQLPKTGTFPIPSESVSVKSGGTEASITFPSLQSLDENGKIFNTTKNMMLDIVCRGCSREYCGKVGEVDTKECKSEVDTKEGESEVDTRECVKAYYLQKPKKKPTLKKNPGFVLETTAKSVTADRDGNGGIRLALTISTKTVTAKSGQKTKQPLCKKIRLKLKGGDVDKLVAVPTDMVSPHPSQYVLVKSGRIALSLTNLNPKNTLSFSATCEEGDGKGADPVELTVSVVTALPSTVLPVSVSETE